MPAFFLLLICLKYCLYGNRLYLFGLKNNKFCNFALRDQCNHMNLKLLLRSSAYMICTPERGSRQTGCLIYRLEGVFKLFLPYGLEHMGVSFHAKKPSSDLPSYVWKIVVQSFLPPYTLWMHSSQVSDQRMLRT